MRIPFTVLPSEDDAPVAEAEKVIVEEHTARSVVEDDDLEELEDPLRPLTIATSNALTTREVEYVLLLPMYPRTDPQGYTYILEYRDGDKYTDLTEHRYCTRRITSGKACKSGFLAPSIANGVPGKMYRTQCTGITRCEHLSEHLRNLSHTHVTEEDLVQMNNVRTSFPDATNWEPRVREAANQYYAINSLFASRGSCKEWIQGCQPACGKFRTPSDTSGTRDTFIKCINHESGKKTHFWKNFRPTGPVDVDALRKFYEGKTPEQVDCYRIEPNTTRAKTCGVPHPQGPGEMLQQDCNVRFHVFVPNEEYRKECPWIFFCSHGIHTHPPPPPAKTPARYWDDLKRLIKMTDSTELTFVRFQTSKAVQDYLALQGADSLGQLHPSLNNASRLQWEIRRQRISTYPHGTQLLGVLHQYQQEKIKEPDKRFIQGVWNDQYGVMIICFHLESAKILLQQTEIEVDMSYKRIRGASLNEILFAKFIEAHDRIITLARVIVSTDTAETYYLTFVRLFELINKTTGQPIYWHHIHGQGIRAIVVDMLSKQARGIGEYFSSITSQKHNWLWHIQHVIVYCLVHFDRSIARAAGRQWSEDSAHWPMQSLKNSTTKEQYFEIIQKLKDHPEEKVRNWAKHKNAESIRCGLHHFFSRMDTNFFQSIRRHTNAVEVAANKGYATGKRLELLIAINKARIRDLADIDIWKARSQLGIQHSWNAGGNIQRTRKNIQRQQSSQQGFSSPDHTWPSPSIQSSPMPPLFAAPMSTSSESNSIPALSSSPLLSRQDHLTPIPNTQPIQFIHKTPSLPRRFASPSTFSAVPASTAFHTALSTGQKRQRPATSSSSVSNTYRRRMPDRTKELEQKRLEIEIQAKELANREMAQRLDREALEFEKAQREFRKKLEEEEQGSSQQLDNVL